MTEAELGALVDTMSLEEQVGLLSGIDFWSTAPIARLGIGSMRVTDGPNGARGGGSFVGGVKSAAFPVGIALGATWNAELAGEIGAAIAEETKAKGAHMLLGPTVNIHRSVTNGRNFECYSEDPILSAKLATAYIRGMQAKGVAATIKHFVANDSEVERNSISSEVGERTLREVYLVPFEAAVKQAGTWGIMSAYNKVNGTFASENDWLLTKVLREDWGYDGIVMSDWFGSHSTAETVNAGLDLEMPGPTRDRGEKLVAAVEAGEVSRETVRTRALNMLRLMSRTGALHDQSERIESELNTPEHRALIRRAGAEAAVLLKNDGDILPLQRTRIGTIAVIGPNAKSAQIMGGGSAQLNPYYRISPWDGLVAAVGAEQLRYAQGGTNARFLPLLPGEMNVEWFDNQKLSGEPVHTETLDSSEGFFVGDPAGGKVDPTAFSMRVTGSFTPDVSATFEIGLFATGLTKAFVDDTLAVDAATDWQAGHTFFEEGCDEVVGKIFLEAGHRYRITIEFVSRPTRNLGITAVRLGIGVPLGDDAIAEAVAAARDAETALIFVGRNAEWDTEGSDLVSIALPGRQNELIAAVAAVNPRTIVVLQTGGPVEMPWIDNVQAVLEAWYPGQEAGNAIADVLFGVAEPSGRLPQSFPVRWEDNPTHAQDPQVYPGFEGKVRYEEGVFIGYRHYDRSGIAPLFSFGHGLGYTAFEVSALSPHAPRLDASGGASVDVEIANTGDREGTTVVQLYVRDVEASLSRPDKELKAFAKLTLAPGEMRKVTFVLNARDFAFFDTAKHCWRVEAGQFELACGLSAADVRARAEITADADIQLPV